MKIRRFEIKHFKGLEKVTLENCGNINAIVGKNNSGKSSVLHAIDMAGLALSLRGWDQFQPKLEIKDLFANLGDFSLSLSFDDDSITSIKTSSHYGPEIEPDPNEAQRIKTILILPDVSGGMLQRRHRTPVNVMNNIDQHNYGEINALDMLYAIKFYGRRSERGMTPQTYDDLIKEVKHYFPDITDIESDRTEQDLSTLTYGEYGRRLRHPLLGNGTETLSRRAAQDHRLRRQDRIAR